MNSSMRTASFEKEFVSLPVLTADAGSQNISPENHLLPFRVVSYVTVCLLCHQFLPR